MQTNIRYIISREMWSVPLMHGTETDENLKDVREKIFKRDNRTCKFCGWRSTRFQEIHHLNHNHNDNNEANLATICPLCHQSFHLFALDVLQGGQMMWCPELTQEQINNYCIHLFMAQRSGGSQAQTADTLYEIFKKRVETLDTHEAFGEHASRPGVFLDTLRLIQENKELPNRRETLDKISDCIKILPNPNRFRQQIDWWVEENGVLKKGDDNYFMRFGKNYLHEAFKTQIEPALREISKSK